MDFLPIKSLGDAVEKLITEHGSAAILRDHLALVRHKFETVAKENETLKKENADLVELNRRLQRELKTDASADDFTPHRGAFFKRLVSGGYDKVVYCPECHRSTFSFNKMIPYKCKSCNWSADFNGLDLEEVMAELPKE